MVVLTELLPSSSSSSTHVLNHHPIHRYDVFLSFRGADTRNGFTDYLYNALIDAGIITFLDDEDIDTGEPLKPELETAIKSSRASIIVMSRNYASSTWCLDELVLILHQKRNCKQIVIPVFYHVEPTHVRKQQNSFGEAMANHKQKMDAEMNEEKRSQFAQKMESWKMALTEVANLKGIDLKDRKEREFIKEVVAKIHRRLSVPLSNEMGRLIGMDYEIEFISSWLRDGSCHTVDILTVVGMSGIGKTSLARHVFRLHSSSFDKSSFIEGINTKASEHFNGLFDLQKQLLGDVSKKIKLQVDDVVGYTLRIENVLARRRVFIVLDDIDSLKQLDALLGNKGLHPGSKVIITTKDASLSKRCALFKSQVHSNHKEVLLKGLYEHDSLELLCVHAFKSQNPKEGYEKISEKLVKYCDGHPLSIEVLGKSLYERDVAYWEECIKGLKKETYPGIKKALHMSFDSLELNDKELFKHIACFFVGIDRDVTETILNACDINTSYGITNLIDRSFLSIKLHNKLKMHSLIQEMGRALVRQESLYKPWKRSRLWSHEESFEVLEQQKGTGNIIGLALDMRMLEKENLGGPLQLETNALSKMYKLKLLQLNYVKMNGSYRNVSKELRWLCMHGFRFKSIPSELLVDKLVVLDMSYSKIESFDMSYSSSQRFVNKLKGLFGLSSNENRLLGSLKILDLSFCEQLHSVGGFFLLPALERLTLRNCTSLIKVCESVEQCDELAHIDLCYCYNLRELPKLLGKLKKVKTMLLDGHGGISRESQIEIGNVKAIPSDLKFVRIPLPSSLRILSLANNNLSNECFPMDLSCLSMLEELCLDNNPIVSMPICVRTLPSLERLYMDDCYKMMSIEHPPYTLRELSVENYSRNVSVRKIKFYPEMSPLLFHVKPLLLSLEIDGMMKIQGLASVEEKVLHRLGWTNLGSTKEMLLKTSIYGEKYGEGSIKCQTQIYYEFGIFSTFYKGKKMPECINCSCKGRSISFTMPSSPNNLRGLNFCYMEKNRGNNPLNSCFFEIPLIKISNITKNRTWIYNHRFDRVEFCGNKPYYKDDGEYSENAEENSEDAEFGGNEHYFEDGEEYFEDAEEYFEDGEEHFEDGEEYFEYAEEYFEDGEEYFEDGKEDYENVELDGTELSFEDGEENSEDAEENSEEDSEDSRNEYYFLRGKDYVGMLSHWMFGENDMKAGDHITITVKDLYSFRDQRTMECGIGLVYDEDGKSEEEEDVLRYYKSWNHIIGGDLSAFQVTTGEYILDHNQFSRVSPEIIWDYYPLIDYGTKFKEEKMSFKAFSEKGRRLK